ncbi:carboxylesterase/lipase family protein [Pseudonocardia humida]|uniref:Carboxylic ester hydrolase n=1 Tax=Pseudonocardia humida TaxID=2800819 RepID=A0ABT1ADL3_9PSEU|nr:carboxylesterase family protein [Pseudonocardia humida]MCO1661165.1 carboxylesterase family protein [Pseudonocardia humida]
MPRHGSSRAVPLPAVLTAVLTAALSAALVACSSGAPPGGAPPGPADDAVVVTAGGAVRGTTTAEHRRFTAIPYAAAPVGERRWRSPEPPAPWTGTRDATVPSTPCPQTWGPNPDGTPQVTGAEDCLQLTVDTPRRAAAPRPVMVFLHGGRSSGQGGLYDPRRIVTGGDVVVVTVNSRLGALGALAHPALDDPAVGNFGLADQQAALRWVRDNIAAFGGDPGNVTLWGESAGGFDTCAHLASPSARGLFAKAIVQSASCANPVVARDTAEQRAAAVAAELGCPDPATAPQCLRALPVEALVGLREADVTTTVFAAVADAPWWPVAGTPLLPVQPGDALRDGTFADVPLIHGATRDEMRSRVAAAYDLQGAPVTAERYPAILADLFGPEAARAAVERYPLAAFSSPSLALATALGDQGGMVGSCAQVPVHAAAAAGEPVFGYEFAEPVADVAGTVPLGAHHGADVRYFFDSTQPGRPPAQRTPQQQRLADRLIGWWTTFARTGSPGPDWPPVPDGGVLSITAAGTAPVDLAVAHHCDLWQRVAPPTG